MTEFAQGGRGAQMTEHAVDLLRSAVGRVRLQDHGSVGAGVRRLPRERVTWDVRYRRRALAADALAGLASGAVGAMLLPAGSGPLPLALVAFGTVLVWVAALACLHGYERRYLGTTTNEYRAVAQSAVALVAIAGLLSYGIGLEVPRTLLAAQTGLLLVLGLAGRHVLRRNLYQRRARGLDRQATVVIGNVRSVGPLVREMQRATDQGLDVVAACVSGLVSSGEAPSDVEGVPVFGYPEEAMSAVDLFDAEVVAVSSDPDLHGSELRRLAWSLEERAVDLVVSPGLLGVAGPRLSIRPTAGMPLLHVERPVMSGARRVVKAVVDRLLTVTLALLALPVLLLIAVAVRIDSPGPVLFRQVRVGERGETFEMLKFRTMCVDAEARLAALTSAADAGNAVLFKMKDDPRVTRVGRVLRRYSLDELPQLFNVLRGEMSLVGPRPPLPREVESYESDAVRRLRVKPGLTGLWQVSGRSDLSWDESLRLDLWYVDNWSFVLDVQILIRTARAVLRGSGAY